MAEQARFFDAVETSPGVYDRIYSASDFAGLVNALLADRDGVLVGYGNELAVSAGAGLSISLGTGFYFANGYEYENSAAITIPITANVSGSTRVDRVVLRLDLDNRTFGYHLIVGTPGAGAPALSATSTVIDFPVARVTIDTGVGGINAADIQNEATRITLSADFGMLKPAVRLATAAAMAASTRTGNRRVANANGAMANIDGVAPARGDRILDKDNATGADRGIWIIRDLGAAARPWVMERADDADTSTKVKGGLIVRASEGTANSDATFGLTTDDPITLNTTTLTFVRTTPPSIPWHVEWTFANPGVPSAGTNFANPYRADVPTGWTRTITKVATGVRGGTSVTFDMRKSSSISGVTAGTTLTGMTSLSATTSSIGTPTTPTSYGLADGDLIAPVASAVTASPDNWIVQVSGLLTYTG